MQSVTQKLLVAAIDLGTDDSGYAFSFLHEYNYDPTCVCIKTWNSGYLFNAKQPTCVLCNPAGEFNSFGYEAENKYSELSADNEHYKWYFFRKFINMLSEKKVNMGLELTDEKGLKMPAIKIFSMAIRYHKDDFLNALNLQGVKRLREDDIHWVLPVPVTWTVSAKEFLREAATEAGIDGANLIIVLEPDAAAVYCTWFPSDRFLDGGRFDDKYMVIDLGDSTAVFSVHEKQPNGTIIDVHKVSSRPWGSTKVNEEFTQMIINIIGDRTFKTFCDDNPEDLVDMLREVEMKKRGICTNTNNTITIHIPTALVETYTKITRKTVQDAIEQSPYKGKIKWKAGKMCLDAELFRSFFKNCISNIIDHIENLCQEPDVKGTSAFLIIGKFAKCRLVQDAVINAFPKAKVVVPNEPELGVMKGAVVLGHKFGLTYGYNLRLQQPMNKDHSAVATTTAKRDEDDVYSDDNANGSTCSSSYEQDFRTDQIKNLKYKSLSEEGEEALTSDNLEITVQTQDKSTQGLETQLKNQMTLEATKRDEDDVYSDDNANGSTSSSSYDFSEEGEEALSSDVLEMTVQTQNKSTQGLETQLKNQMTLEATKRDEDDVYSDDNANGSTSSRTYDLSEEGEEALSSDVLEMTVQTQDKSTQRLETQLKNKMTLEATKRDEDDVYSDDNANGSTSSSSYNLSEEGEEALSSDVLEMTVQTQDKSTQGLETQLKNQMTLEANNTRAPSDDELFTLSRQLSKVDKEWWFLAKLLGLSDKQIDEIERGEGSKHIVRQYYRMLIAWKGHNEGQEKGSVRYLLRQCDEADIDRKVTAAVFGI